MSTNYLSGCGLQDSLNKLGRWIGRLRTARAMALLSLAQLTVGTVKFSRWRGRLGTKDGDKTPGRPSDADLENGRRAAALIEHAARRLPFPTKCLPRAVAVSWILRRDSVPHTLVFAVRPATHRPSPDSMHAWVEISGNKIIGELDGPWVETLRLGQ